MATGQNRFRGDSHCEQIMSASSRIWVHANAWPARSIKWPRAPGIPLTRVWKWCLRTPISCVPPMTRVGTRIWFSQGRYRRRRGLGRPAHCLGTIGGNHRLRTFDLFECKQLAQSTLNWLTKELRVQSSRDSQIAGASEARRFPAAPSGLRRNKHRCMPV